MTSSSHCDEWHRKDGAHQVNSCSVFCFSLSTAWPTAPLSTHYPSLSQRQVCSLPCGPFCVTHHCDVVINQFILTDSSVGEVGVMSLPCLTVIVAFSWGLTCFVPSLTPNLLAVGGQCVSHKLRAWCLCLLDF